jgi:hypothetical protein
MQNDPTTATANAVATKFFHLFIPPNLNMVIYFYTTGFIKIKLQKTLK